MDVEELRRSQRRIKKPRPELGYGMTLNPPSSTVSVSGSQDSEDDEDEVSTPSAEHAERNLLSLLSVRFDTKTHLKVGELNLTPLLHAVRKVWIALVGANPI